MPLLVAYRYRKPSELLCWPARWWCSMSAIDDSCTDVVKQNGTIRKPLDFYNAANHRGQKEKRTSALPSGSATRAAAVATKRLARGRWHSPASLCFSNLIAPEQNTTPLRL